MPVRALCLLLGALPIAAILGACSDDDDGPQCPDVSGLWKVTQHCQPSAVGSQLAVQQSGCNFSTSGGEFNGSVASSGEVSVTGSLAGFPIQCSGTATP